MSEENSKKCFNCNSTHEEVPVMLWHYKERELWLCANCLPLMIHKREQLALDPPERKSRFDDEGKDRNRHCEERLSRRSNLKVNARDCFAKNARNDSMRRDGLHQTS